MAKARTLDKRRKSVRNIQKITRTMELIATARFKKAMDRATAATAYTQRMSRLVSDLTHAGVEVAHPLLEKREATDNALLLVLSGNRGMCGGYNSSVIRLALAYYNELLGEFNNVQMEVSGKRGIAAMRFRRVDLSESYTTFEDKPTYDEVEALANRYLEQYVTGAVDRVDVVYTSFVSISRQIATVETLLPLGSLPESAPAAGAENSGGAQYEFLPSAESILQEVVPTSVKIKLFKFFLDSAVSEQIARMVAMKSATDNAQDMIRMLSMTYNRARQSQITNEIMEVIGGVEALES
jgi:F-type H+-transporting ATPase subunit gamma